MTLPQLQPSNSKEIVLVDDDEMQHFVIRKYFEANKINYSLISFRDGNSFLAYMDEVTKLKHQMPALVLLDIRMPDKDGFEILKIIRNNHAVTEQPIILMFSNSDAPSDIEKSKVLGASGFQTKPNSIDGLDSFFSILLQIKKFPG